MLRLLFALALVLISGAALAQAVPGTPAPSDGSTTSPELHTFGIWPLFQQSFDVFTVLLIGGSIIALAVVFSCMLDIRASRILPRRSVERIMALTAHSEWDDLRDYVARDNSYVGRVVRAAMLSARTGDRDAVRDAAELAAAEESARWFRRIEVLNVVGNLGPLIGLAGTVWGMILAFTSLGQAGGQADPTALSTGISKALFHTLLGLSLAIPCLLVFGLYRSIVDRICTRGMVLSSQVVDRLPNAGTARSGVFGR